ncbi:MAG: redox-sensing transcriptional repressor Rex [Firmicutes bacterium]|nr:redox-sensing transcriptional repressor Rex [Bacillota bacterium]
MGDTKKISLEVIKRLPRYYRYLGELGKSNITRISSKELSEKMDVTASQIRQDLNCFGGFGQQGYGYNVESLYNSIGEILGLNHGHKTIIVGAGNLGKALALYKSFEKRGFKLIGIFDNSKSKIGTFIGRHEVLDICTVEEFIKKNEPEIAVIAVPKEAVGEITALLSKCKIKGILNFSYTDISTLNGVEVENVHISDSLMMLSYKIKDIE